MFQLQLFWTNMSGASSSHDSLMPKTTFFTAKMAVITVGDSQDTLDSACESNAWCQSNEINETTWNKWTWDGIRMGWWCNDDTIWTYHESKQKHNEVQPRVHVRLMRGSTHPPLGMRCWKCFCIMPSIVMRSPLLSLGFYEKFGIAIDGTDDWCIYIDAMLAAKWREFLKFRLTHLTSRCTHLHCTSI